MQNLRLYEVRYTLADIFRGGRYLLGSSPKVVYDFMKAWEEDISDIKAEEVLVVQGMDGGVGGDYLIGIRMEKEVDEAELEEIPRDLFNEENTGLNEYVDPKEDKLRFYRAIYLNLNGIPCHEYLVGKNAKQIYEYIKNDEDAKAVRGEAFEIYIEEVRTEIGVIGSQYGFFVFDVEVIRKLEEGEAEPKAELYP